MNLKTTKEPKPKRDQQLEDSMQAAQEYWATLDNKLLGHFAVLQAELARSINGVALQGCQPKQVRTGAGNGTRAATSAGRCVGWSLRETAGAATVVYLRDGVDSAGDIVAVIQLPANSSQTIGPTSTGISFGVGLYVDPGVGAIEGAVYLGAVD